MAIDGRHETIFPLTESAKRAEPIIGRRLATSTFYRWAGRGCKGVRLETRMLGGTRHTSIEALERFFDRLTEATNSHNDGEVAIAPRRNREAEIAQAERELDAAGI